MQEAGIIFMKKCTLYAQASTTEIYDNVFCEDANLRDTIKGHKILKDTFRIKLHFKKVIYLKGIKNVYFPKK